MSVSSFCVIGLALSVMIVLALWLACELSKKESEYWEYDESGRVYDPDEQIENPAKKGLLDGADLVCNKGDGKQIEKWIKRYGEKTT